MTAPKDCSVDCQQLVYLARQVQIGLSRDASRASHALAAAQPLNSEYEAKLAREYPQLQRYPMDLTTFSKTTGDHAVPQLWIIDPTAIWCCATTRPSRARTCSTTCATC